MESQQSNNQLHVIFLPYPSPGHMILMIDTARLFAKHGVNVTIIATHANASTFQKSIDSDFNSGYSIKTQLIQFPSSQVGLPDGVENVKDVNDRTSLEMLGKISHGMSMLQDQIEVLFQDLQSDCIITDMMYPWTVESAAKLNIPRLYYYSSSYFSNCATYFVRKYRPRDNLVSDTQKFTIPCLPHTIEMTRLQLRDWIRATNATTAYFELIFDSELRNYGTLYNSFHELESDYEKLSKTTIRIKSWSIGQLVEIAYGLENPGHNFIWVVRKNDRGVENGECFLQDFEERMKESNKGYIIWNWAPQLLILDHLATGGIVTHCRWNSILESLSVGLPMITWPMFAEQFENEKLLVDVLKIGVAVGAKENKIWNSFSVEAMVRREEIAKLLRF
ncbi:unnamed protein product [Trifolium pratense]|uniref:Uncharacterized protein n=1 Tax=Trifolium pratense TaxID=57577 RepID=A0ACB0L8P6_TRIPR|nr:unnamed protein product [Trifolium pratense]